MSGFPRVCTPEDYTERLVELADSLMQARQRVQFEILARDAAVKAFGQHLQVPTGEERIAVIGDLFFRVARSGDNYIAEVNRIHATANQESQ